MSNCLRVAGVSKVFGKVKVLDGLDFEVPEGSVFALIGPNGAGKTTTIKILLDALQPTSGHATVLGVDSRNIGPRELEKIGYVSENQEMPGWMTVDYMMAYLRPFYPTWDDSWARKLVDRFNLPPDRPLRHLSRGMLMKAALASSLAYHPRLLVMDEPFSGLDPLVREELIENLAASAGETTILVSSHDLGELESFASHIGFLDRGSLQFTEEMASLAARFRQIEITLEEPAVNVRADVAWPATWLRREATPTVVRFVDSGFHSERTPGEIGHVFGNVRHISIQAMPLRTIFVTLARHAGRAA